MVPFGVPGRPARGDRAAGRRAAGVPEDGPLVLFGGIYDWNVPELLLDAWPAVRRKEPEARLLFLDSPNPETTPQRVYAEARRRARTLDPDGRSIVFSPWLPYDAREDLYAAADLLVSISSDGLESDLSYRTRLLDAAWGGVPSISISAGALGREIEDARAGRRVERSAGALAEGVVTALSDHARLSAAARRFAQERTWGRVARPLLSWCRGARVNGGRLPLPESSAPRFWSRFRRRTASSS